MELRLLGILLELLILRKGHAVITHRIIHASGEQASLPCETVNPHIRLFWFPLNSRCANISQGSVEITWNPTKYEVTPLRFNQRLTYHTPKSLLLKNLVMSDAGTYICILPNRSETHTILQVTPGCHNHLLVSYQWLDLSSLQLSCHHCELPGRADAFRWTLNSRRLGNPHWADKNNFGSSVTLYPIRPVVWGRWECHSVANPAWVSEICLTPPRGRKDSGTPRILQEEFPSAEPSASLASSHWALPTITTTTDTALAGRDVNGFAVLGWALLLFGLILVLSMAVWLWKRQVIGRKRRGRKEWTDRASLRNSIRTNDEICETENLDKVSVSLHYAQLQHPRRKSSAVRTPDSTTVYAVIV